MSVLTLDEWEIDRECVVINRKLGEGAFGMVYGGESCLDRETDKQWVRCLRFIILILGNSHGRSSYVYIYILGCCCC